MITIASQSCAAIPFSVAVTNPDSSKLGIRDLIKRLVYRAGCYNVNNPASISWSNPLSLLNLLPQPALPTHFAMLLFRRKEMPWEVVDTRNVDPVPMYYEDEGERETLIDLRPAE